MRPQMQQGDTKHEGQHQKKAVPYDMLATAADMAVTTKAMLPDHAQSLLYAKAAGESLIQWSLHPNENGE